MKIYLAFNFFVCICTLGLVTSKCVKQTSIDFKTYKIDLDQPADQRFIQTSIDFANEIKALVDAQKKLLKIPDEVITLIEFIASQIDKLFPYPFNQELRGISKATGIKLGDVVFANLIYDITAFCTGIVATQENGQIIHGRNLDYDFPNYLKNLTYIAEFYQNGSLVFTSAHIAGFVGILTGHKYNKFTFSINERDQGQWWINLLFAIIDKKASPLSFITRKVMENATSFEQAVDILSTSDLIAPCYFIVGGVHPGQGAVITRNQYKLVDLWKLNPESTGIEKWYLLETNYDHWLPPPASDDRQTPGMMAMNTTTQANINLDTLMDVMTLDPVCNKETVYSVAMSAAVEASKGGFQVLIR
ncbi:unnamed protein product [Brachionus calyciflorus]|uniref:N-acylethanolamine-hydrolyzing acid amidase n=1 Tax=Brachionus calyciflorus TaxID=104777 RepID=A0A813XJY5_9BILA|nr:unnamed protein product [Brachionus calyciflorus]